jgi:Cu/Ag efflux pump CusA
LFLTRTNFSVSSAVGFLALFGVSVEIGVIMIEFINQLRVRRKPTEKSSREHIIEAAVEGAVLRLRPIMMTMLVATLGLLPAATSHAIGSDSQRPFAIVIVGGLLANLIIGIFLLPTPGPTHLNSYMQDRESRLRWGYVESPEIFFGVDGPAGRTDAASSVVRHCVYRHCGDSVRSRQLG